MTTQPQHPLNPSPSAGMAGLIPGTPYAIAYNSRHSQAFFSPAELQLLGHVNCSYLSTDGVPPTLLALKRHAHALAVLIQKLTLSTTTGQINSHGERDDDSGGNRHAFAANEAFDWLNDLSQPYSNDDEWHHAPLVSLMNAVAQERELTGVRHHCALTNYVGAADAGLPPQPFATHYNLAMHANECLEVLDHEYSADGGLLGLIPPLAREDAPDDGADEGGADQGQAAGDGRHREQQQEQEQEQRAAELAAMRSTVLGQWLLFTQHLVARMHELELSYAAALDALADEAAVPSQLLSRAGPEAAARGRPIAYPQDRWVLAHAGDDICAFVHRLMDEEEKLLRVKEKEWQDAGVSPSRADDPAENAGAYLDAAEAAALAGRARRERLEARQQTIGAGLCIVDVETRYMRLREHGREGPIFVLPAYGRHPHVSHTRELERRPTVVTVAAPSYPTPVSAWQQQYQAKIDAADEVARRNHALERDLHDSNQRSSQLAEELRRQNMLVHHYEASVGVPAKQQLSRLNGELARARSDLQTAANDLEELEGLVAGIYPNGWREALPGRQIAAAESRAGAAPARGRGSGRDQPAVDDDDGEGR